MATVYLAHDLKHDRDVAVKVLRPEIAAAIGTERFLREIEITARLTHPNILPLYDSGVSSPIDPGGLTLPWYTMPHVQGESLRARLKRELQLPLPEVLGIAQDIAGALGYAHEQGLVHRDIKPENILLESGRAVLADFGIARAIRAAVRPDGSSGSLAIGTPPYMSPEQVAGGQPLDGRSDVYALGCVLYEMLAGSPPYTGATAESIARQHIVGPVPSVRVIRPSVPPSVDEAITRALAKVPADRFQDATAFRHALSAVALPVASRPRWHRGVAMIALLGAVIVAGALLLRHQGGREGAGAPPSPDAPRLAVMYFENATADSSLRLMADGLTEALIHELGGFNAFRVISRNGVRPFRDRRIPFDSMVRALGVALVIDGSLRQIGDTLLLGVDLIDGATGTIVDSVLIQRPVDQAGLEREVPPQVAAALRRRLGVTIRLRGPGDRTTSSVAGTLVLKARQERDDASALLANPAAGGLGAARMAWRRADSLLALAARADPAWLRPLLDRGWVRLEQTAALAGPEGALSLQEGLTFANEAVRQAPRNAEALQLRGTLTWGLVTQLEAAPEDTSRVTRAESDLRAALALDSTLAGAWATLSYVLWLKGDFAPAAAAAQRALREDAYLAEARAIHEELFFDYLMLGDIRQAGEWCRRGRLSSPDDWRFVECELTLLRHNTRARPNPDSAWALVRTLERLDPAGRMPAAGGAYHPIYRRVVAATVEARAGHRARAEAELARARRATAGDSSLRLDLAPDEALLLAELGEKEEARKVFGSMITARPVLARLLTRAPIFAELGIDVAPAAAP